MPYLNGTTKLSEKIEALNALGITGDLAVEIASASGAHERHEARIDEVQRALGISADHRADTSCEGAAAALACLIDHIGAGGPRGFGDRLYTGAVGSSERVKPLWGFPRKSQQSGPAWTAAIAAVLDRLTYGGSFILDLQGAWYAKRDEYDRIDAPYWRGWLSFVCVGGVEADKAKSLRIEIDFAGAAPALKIDKVYLDNDDQAVELCDLAELATLAKVVAAAAVGQIPPLYDWSKTPRLRAIQLGVWSQLFDAASGKTPSIHDPAWVDDGCGEVGIDAAPADHLVEIGGPDDELLTI